MDFIVPIIIIILLFITCSVCGYCCKRNKQGIVYGTPQTNAVTSTTTNQYQTTPYPVMETPMPQPGPPGFVPHAAYPPTTPYPPTTGFGHINMPMPMAGNFPTAAPYPSMPTMPMPQPQPPAPYSAPVPAYPATSSATQMPPSYAEAVAVTNEGYAKQSPYNPNYN